MRKFVLVLALCLVSMKLLAAGPGDVVINEIMWMGTAASSSDEWIELYNNTESDIDLTNWILQSADTVPKIILTGTIKAKDYYLLERTDDNTVKDIAADKIYTGALSDTGEDLVLYDSYTVVMDSAPCSAGWFAGAKSPYYSMERMNPREGGWLSANWGNNNGVTANGSDANGNPLSATPKAQNSIYYEGDAGSEGETGNPAVEYRLRLTEVAFASATDWVEIYNYGDIPVDMANFMLTDLDGTDTKLANKSATLAPGKYAVVYWDESGVDETDETGDLNGNGIMDLYITDTGLSATTDQVVLMSAAGGGQFIDAVCWSDGIGEFASGEDKDVKLLFDNGQWAISGDTVTKNDCWTDSSQLTAEMSIGRLSATAADTHGKADWHLFKRQTPGSDNPSLEPPRVEVDFDPSPPFPTGTVKVTLRIGTANPILEPPVVSFAEGLEDFQDIILQGAGNSWNGEFIIPEDEAEKSLVFKYKVVDSARNTTEQELMFLALAYAPPDHGQNMYCSPNPWTPATGQKLKFSRLGEETVTIRIFNLNGEQVKALDGLGEAYWDGTNEGGARVAAGIYLYFMENARLTRQGKIAIVK